MKYPSYKYVLAFLDWSLLSIAFVLSNAIRTSFEHSFFLERYPYLSIEVLFFMVFALFGSLIFQYNNLYKINVILSVADQFARLIRSISYIVIGYAVLSFFTKSSAINESRLSLLLFIVLSVGFLMLFRAVIFRQALKFLAKHNFYKRHVVIIGSGRMAKLLAANLLLDNSYGVRIIGFIDDEIPAGTPIFRGLKVVGGLDEVEELAGHYPLDEIMVCVEEMTHAGLVDILERCQRTNALVKIASPLYDIIPGFRFTEQCGGIPVIGLAQTSFGPIQETYKRMFDIVLASLGLILFLPVFLFLALAIKLDSRGSILYRQVRIGKNGKPFDFYKFRSMLVGSDQDEERIQKFAELIKCSTSQGNTKIVDESKITRIGRFIRKTSLDELPQLLNVLKGDMSLVGPRPCLPYEWAHYEDWHKKRLSIIPGCTGVWQVSGRSSVGFNDMVILDFYYIQNASLFLDVQLILKTIPVMIFGKGGK